MGLSCSCPEWDGDPDCWCYLEPNDFSKFKQKRRKRCKSCGDLISIDSDCIEFGRFRYARDDIEYRIYGDDTEIPMASLFWCDKCAEVYFNLTSIGYCLSPTDCAIEVLKEYWKLTGFKPKQST